VIIYESVGVIGPQRATSPHGILNFPYHSIPAKVSSVLKLFLYFFFCMTSKADKVHVFHTLCTKCLLSFVLRLVLKLPRDPRKRRLKQKGDSIYIV
jgi:hypothetical protein